MRSHRFPHVSCGGEHLWLPDQALPGGPPSLAGVASDLGKQPSCPIARGCPALGQAPVNSASLAMAISSGSVTSFHSLLRQRPCGNPQEVSQEDSDPCCLRFSLTAAQERILLCPPQPHTAAPAHTPSFVQECDWGWWRVLRGGGC